MKHNKAKFIHKEENCGDQSAAFEDLQSTDTCNAGEEVQKFPTETSGRKTSKGFHLYDWRAEPACRDTGLRRRSSIEVLLSEQTCRKPFQICCHRCEVDSSKATNDNRDKTITTVACCSNDSCFAGFSAVAETLKSMCYQVNTNDEPLETIDPLCVKQPLQQHFAEPLEKSNPPKKSTKRQTGSKKAKNYEQTIQGYETSVQLTKEGCADKSTNVAPVKKKKSNHCNRPVVATFNKKVLVHLKKPCRDCSVQLSFDGSNPLGTCKQTYTTKNKSVNVSQKTPKVPDTDNKAMQCENVTPAICMKCNGPMNTFTPGDNSGLTFDTSKLIGIHHEYKQYNNDAMAFTNMSNPPVTAMSMPESQTLETMENMYPLAHEMTNNNAMPSQGDAAYWENFNNDQSALIERSLRRQPKPLMNLEFMMKQNSDDPMNAVALNHFSISGDSICLKTDEWKCNFLKKKQENAEMESRGIHNKKETKDEELHVKAERKSHSKKSRYEKRLKKKGSATYNNISDSQLTEMYGIKEKKAIKYDVMQSNHCYFAQQKDTTRTRSTNNLYASILGEKMYQQDRLSHATKSISPCRYNYNFPFPCTKSVSTNYCCIYDHVGIQTSNVLSCSCDYNRSAAPTYDLNDLALACKERELLTKALKKFERKMRKKNADEDQQPKKGRLKHGKSHHDELKSRKGVAMGTESQILPVLSRTTRHQGEQDEEKKSSKKNGSRKNRKAVNRKYDSCVQLINSDNSFVFKDCRGDGWNELQYNSINEADNQEKGHKSGRNRSTSHASSEKIKGKRAKNSEKLQKQTAARVQVSTKKGQKKHKKKYKVEFSKDIDIDKSHSINKSCRRKGEKSPAKKSLKINDKMESYNFTTSEDEAFCTSGRLMDKSTIVRPSKKMREIATNTKEKAKRADQLEITGDCPSPTPTKHSKKKSMRFWKKKHDGDTTDDDSVSSKKKKHKKKPICSVCTCDSQTKLNLMKAWMGNGDETFFDPMTIIDQAEEDDPPCAWCEKHPDTEDVSDWECEHCARLKYAQENMNTDYQTNNWQYSPENTPDYQTNDWQYNTENTPNYQSNDWQLNTSETPAIKPILKTHMEMFAADNYTRASDAQALVQSDKMAEPFPVVTQSPCTFRKNNETTQNYKQPSQLVYNLPANSNTSQTLLNPDYRDYQKPAIQLEYSDYQNVPPQPDYRDCKKVAIQPEYSEYKKTAIQPEYSEYKKTAIQHEYSDFTKTNVQPENNDYKKANVQSEYNDYKNAAIEYSDYTKTPIEQRDYKKSPIQPSQLVYNLPSHINTSQTLLNTEYSSNQPAIQLEYSDFKKTAMSPEYSDYKKTAIQPSQLVYNVPTHKNTPQTMVNQEFGEYKPAVQSEYGEYNPTTQPDYSEYKSNIQTEYGEYKTTIQPEYGEYKPTIQPENSEYKPTIQPEYGDYKPTIQPEYGEYKKTIQPDYGEYKPNIQPEYSDYKKTPIQPSQLVYNVPTHKITSRTFINPEYGEYNTITNPNYSDYKQTIQPEYSDYNQTIQPEYSDYKQTIQPEYSDYKQTNQPEYGDYKHTIQPDYSDYKHTIQPEYSDYKKKPIKLEYGDYKKTSRQPEYSDYKKTPIQPEYSDYKKTPLQPSQLVYNVPSHKNTSQTLLNPEYGDYKPAIKTEYCDYKKTHIQPSQLVYNVPSLKNTSKTFLNPEYSDYRTTHMPLTENDAFNMPAHTTSLPMDNSVCDDYQTTQMPHVENDQLQTHNDTSLPKETLEYEDYDKLKMPNKENDPFKNHLYLQKQYHTNKCIADNHLHIRSKKCAPRKNTQPVFPEVNRHCLGDRNFTNNYTQGGKKLVHKTSSESLLENQELSSSSGQLISESDAIGNDRSGCSSVISADNVIICSKNPSYTAADKTIETHYIKEKVNKLESFSSVDVNFDKISMVNYSEDRSVLDENELSRNTYTQDDSYAPMTQEIISFDKLGFGEATEDVNELSPPVALASNTVDLWLNSSRKQYETECHQLLVEDCKAKSCLRNTPLVENTIAAKNNVNTKVSFFENKSSGKESKKSIRSSVSKMIHKSFSQSGGDSKESSESSASESDSSSSETFTTTEPHWSLDNNPSVKVNVIPCCKQVTLNTQTVRKAPYNFPPKKKSPFWSTHLTYTSRICKKRYNRGPDCQDYYSNESSSCTLQSNDEENSHDDRIYSKRSKKDTLQKKPKGKSKEIKNKKKPLKITEIEEAKIKVSEKRKDNKKLKQKNQEAKKQVKKKDVRAVPESSSVSDTSSIPEYRSTPNICSMPECRTLIDSCYKPMDQEYRDPAPNIDRIIKKYTNDSYCCKDGTWRCDESSVVGKLKQDDNVNKYTQAHERSRCRETYFSICKNRGHCSDQSIDICPRCARDEKSSNETKKEETGDSCGGVFARKLKFLCCKMRKKPKSKEPKPDIKAGLEADEGVMEGKRSKHQLNLKQKGDYYKVENHQRGKKIFTEKKLKPIVKEFEREFPNKRKTAQILEAEIIGLPPQIPKRQLDSSTDANEQRLENFKNMECYQTQYPGSNFIPSYDLLNDRLACCRTKIYNEKKSVNHETPTKQYYNTTAAVEQFDTQHDRVPGCRTKRCNEKEILNYESPTTQYYTTTAGLEQFDSQQKNYYDCKTTYDQNTFHPYCTQMTMENAQAKPLPEAQNHITFDIKAAKTQYFKENITPNYNLITETKMSGPSPNIGYTSQNPNYHNSNNYGGKEPYNSYNVTPKGHPFDAYENTQAYYCDDPYSQWRNSSAGWYPLYDQKMKKCDQQGHQQDKVNILREVKEDIAKICKETIKEQLKERRLRGESTSDTQITKMEADKSGKPKREIQSHVSIMRVAKQDDRKIQDAPRTEEHVPTDSECSISFVIYCGKNGKKKKIRIKKTNNTYNDNQEPHFREKEKPTNHFYEDMTDSSKACEENCAKYHTAKEKKAENEYDDTESDSPTSVKQASSSSSYKKNNQKKTKHAKENDVDNESVSSNDSSSSAKCKNKKNKSKQHTEGKKNTEKKKSDNDGNKKYKSNQDGDANNRYNKVEEPKDESIDIVDILVAHTPRGIDDKEQGKAEGKCVTSGRDSSYLWDSKMVARVQDRMRYTYQK